MVLRKVAVFGGTGYVGAKVLESLADSSQGLGLLSFSRKGTCPKHATSLAWTKKVQWLAGDVFNKDTFEHELDASTSVVISVGSPPTPSFTQEQEQAQFRMNGVSCESVIKAAEAKGVSRIVLVSAAMPSWVPKGYREGKEYALEAAKGFCERTGGDAVVVQPAAISGQRHTESGHAVPLNYVLGPLSWVLEKMESVGVKGKLVELAPSIFTNVLEPFPSVEQLGKVLSRAAVDESYTGKGLTIIQNHEILQEKS